MKISVTTPIDRIAEIMNSINPVELVTPTNVKEVKDFWIKAAKNGYYTNPPFSYDSELLKEVASYGNALAIARAQLADGIIPENAAEAVIKDILLSRIDDAIIGTEIAASILLRDDGATAELSQQLYGRPSNGQALKAYQIALGEEVREAKKPRFTKKERDRLKAMEFDSVQIGYWITEAVNYYGFKGWTVEVGDQYTATDVRDKSSGNGPVIGIPTDRKVDGLKLLELIGHEIECHLRGSENCKALIESIIGADSPLAPFIPVIAKSDNELFYEGVAKINDVELNGSDSLPLPYATVACDQARRGESFAKIAEMIKGQREDNGQTNDAAVKGAWATTYRIMRGCTNTGAGGYAFTKDYVYMCGYEVAQQVSPTFREFSSLKIGELTQLSEVCDLSAPRFAKKDAVDHFKRSLLAKK